MSKTFLTFFVCFFFFFLLLHKANAHPQADANPEEVVTIEDAALRGVIEAKLGKSSGDTITVSEMNDMTGDLI